MLALGVVLLGPAVAGCGGTHRDGTSKDAGSVQGAATNGAATGGATASRVASSGVTAAATSSAATSSSATSSATTSGVTTSSASASVAPQGERQPARDADNDYDGSGKGRYDSDDYRIVAYGRAANRAERGAVTALVERYYAAAAAGDGARACPLIYSLFAEAIVEEDGQANGPPALRGDTCAVVFSKVFELSHQQLVLDNATLRVTGVRVQGKRGYALLSFGATPEHEIRLHREFGVWKIDALNDSGLG
jgi:hypothetical protein